MFLHFLPPRGDHILPRGALAVNFNPIRATEALLLSISLNKEQLHEFFVEKGKKNKDDAIW